MSGYGYYCNTIYNTGIVGPDLYSPALPEDTSLTSLGLGQGRNTLLLCWQQGPPEHLLNIEEPNAGLPEADEAEEAENTIPRNRIDFAARRSAAAGNSAEEGNLGLGMDMDNEFNLHAHNPLLGPAETRDFVRYRLTEAFRDGGSGKTTIDFGDGDGDVNVEDEANFWFEADTRVGDVCFVDLSRRRLTLKTLQAEVLPEVAKVVRNNNNNTFIHPFMHSFG